MTIDTSSPIAIITAQETIYFSHVAGQLCQWLLLTLLNHATMPLNGTVTIVAGGKEMTTPVALLPGVHEYRVYAPLLWPAPPDPQAQIRLTISQTTVTLTTSVGSHRPWTIYLLSDVCTDYTWVYADEELPRAHDAAITEAELRLAEATAGEDSANRNHYNFVHAREAEFFLEHYSDQSRRFFEHIRQGTITLNPFFNMALTCDMSLEELIRQFYPARAWAREHSLDIGYANHQETPTIAWIMATVLAGSGIDHLVKSILPYECPWASRLEEPPVFDWEGPDGSRIRVRRRNEDYVEGNFVLRDLRTTILALHDNIIPRYEGLGGQYPFGAIALVGCYGDLSPESKLLPAKKAATIAAYNGQGWDYPKLVNASHKQFWDDLEAQVTVQALQLPVYRGDYGASWEAWPASLAYDFAGWRRAQERAGTADKLAALLSGLDRSWYNSHCQHLAQGWLNLTYLADHAWNGANDANRAFNAALRRRWQETANSAFDKVITTGLAALAQQIPTEPKRERLLLFNSLGWSRTGIVRVTGLAEDTRLTDLTTGEAVATQGAREGDQSVLYLEAPQIPAVGYRVLAINPTATHLPVPASPWSLAEGLLEGPYYRLQVSPATGGLVSLYDKIRQRELVDSQSDYHLNQAVYLSEGLEHTAQGAQVGLGAQGSLFAQLVMRTSLKHIRLTTTFTLYRQLDRVDILNQVTKLPTAERHELSFVFPIQVPDRQYRFEAPGVIVTPGVEQRPGAGQAVTAVRHFVDVFNSEFGVTLSQADSGLVQFGRRTSTADPLEPEPGNSTIWALALGNNINWREVTRDQAGATNFTFRYSLRGHAGGFDPVSAIKFGWEDNNELLALPLAWGQRGNLPPHRHSFVQVDPDHVILTGLKVAEEEGLLLRLWECAGQSTAAVVKVSGLGALSAALQTDLLEKDIEALSLMDGQFSVPLKARGLAAVRLLQELRGQHPE